MRSENSIMALMMTSRYCSCNPATRSRADTVAYTSWSGSAHSIFTQTSYNVKQALLLTLPGERLVEVNIRYIRQHLDEDRHGDLNVCARQIHSQLCKTNIALYTWIRLKCVSKVVVRNVSEHTIKTLSSNVSTSAPSAGSALVSTFEVTNSMVESTSGLSSSSLSSPILNAKSDRINWWMSNSKLWRASALGHFCILKTCQSIAACIEL